MEGEEGRGDGGWEGAGRGGRGGEGVENVREALAVPDLGSLTNI